MAKSTKPEVDARDDKDVVCDPLQMLKDDHEKVKHLFDEFEDCDDEGAKGDIADTVIRELVVHTALEEEIFYPAVREKIEDDLMKEALEEHHFAKVAIAELSKMKPGDEQYDAKVQVLSEMVLHHIEEEESEMFPQVRKLDLDFEGLAARMATRKQELEAEEAKAAQKKAPKKSATKKSDGESKATGKKSATKSGKKKDK